MSFYFRFLTDQAPPTLEEVASNLGDGRYSVDHVTGDVTFDGDVIATVEVTSPDDDLFHAELSELAERASAGRGPGMKTVQRVLQGATAIVALEIATPDTSLLGPLCRTLF